MKLSGSNLISKTNSQWLELSINIINGKRNYYLRCRSRLTARFYFRQQFTH